MCVPRPVSRLIAGASYAGTLQSSATFSGVHLRLPFVASVLTLALAGSTPALTSATVPPRNCGPLTVANRHYVIKADQLRCTTAKTSAKNYLVSHRKPKGFSCRDFKGSKMTFRCSKGIQVFFAIRR